MFLPHLLANLWGCFKKCYAPFHLIGFFRMFPGMFTGHISWYAVCPIKQYIPNHIIYIYTYVHTLLATSCPLYLLYIYVYIHYTLYIIYYTCIYIYIYMYTTISTLNHIQIKPMKSLQTQQVSRLPAGLKASQLTTRAPPLYQLVDRL